MTTPESDTVNRTFNQQKKQRQNILKGFNKKKFLFLLSSRRWCEKKKLQDKSGVK